MPMYEFRCADCSAKFEELIFATADLAEVQCPSCTSPQVTKVLSAFAVLGASGSAGFGEVPARGDDYGGGCASGGCCSGGSCGM